SSLSLLSFPYTTLFRSEGLRFVLANKLILSAVSLDLFAVLFGGATALLPIFAVDILHGGPNALGWLRAAPSVGAVTMALTLAHSDRKSTRLNSSHDQIS